MSVLTVKNENDYFPVGARLSLTGRANGIPQEECIWIGHFGERAGYQHDHDGKVVWVHTDIINAICERDKP